MTKESTKVKWFWYVAREDELMCDLDSRTLLEIALKRLERHSMDGDTCGEWKDSENLNVHSIFVSPSQNPEHYHMVIRLKKPMDTLYRLTWELYFMSHVYRSCKNFFRALEGVPAPSLLISPRQWHTEPRLGIINGEEEKGVWTFWRKSDAICVCPKENHKNPELILECPAHKKLRGTK